MRRLSAFAAFAAFFVGWNLAQAGETVELGGLTSKAPKEWKAQKAANRFRVYQFAVPKVDGDKEDAELVVFFFGEGGGGGVDENLKRWKGFFIPPEGKTIEEASKVEKFKVGKVADVVYLDVNGTFKSKNPPFDPNAKEVRKDNFRRFGVIFDTDKGAYFITLTGPAKTMAKNKDAFDGWIKAFK
ncbi:MAG TPA: hypothetical protein VFE62_27205 [Gemmataceae bacterium]|nr:hypothetical protein [Gemmataceae bacterium]